MLYEGVQLTYALHTGYSSYYDVDKVGATLYTVKYDGTTDLEHIYYDLVDGEWIAR